MRLHEYKQKDPVETALATILKNKFASMSEIETINQKVMEEIDECVRFAEESPYPDASEIYTENS